MVTDGRICQTSVNSQVIPSILKRKMEEIPQKKTSFQKITVPKMQEERKIVEVNKKMKGRTETQKANEGKLKEVMEKVKRKISEEKEAADAKKAKVIEKPHRSGSISNLRRAVEKGQRKVSQKNLISRFWK